MTFGNRNDDLWTLFGRYDIKQTPGNTTRERSKDDGCLTTVSKKCISNTFINLTSDLQRSKKVQKNGFKIDHKPTDTVPKQNVYRKLLRGSKGCPPSPHKQFAKTDYFLNEHERQIWQSVFSFGVCERKKRFAQKSQTRFDTYGGHRILCLE